MLKSPPMMGAGVTDMSDDCEKTVWKRAGSSLSGAYRFTIVYVLLKVDAWVCHHSDM